MPMVNSSLKIGDSPGWSVVARRCAMGVGVSGKPGDVDKSYIRAAPERSFFSCLNHRIVYRNE